MRTKIRIAAAVGTGVIATVLLASPSLAAGQPESVATKGQQTIQQTGTCDGTGIRQQDRDYTGDHLHLRIHQS